MQRILAAAAMLAAAGAIGLPPASARAAPVLDQQSDFPVEPNTGVGGGSIRGQSFTVGLGGTLDSIAVYIQRNAASTLTDDLEVKVVAGESSFAAPAVATAVIPFASVPASVVPGGLGSWVSADFTSAALPVAVGHQFTFWLSTAAAELNFYRWSAAVTDPYPAGRGAIFEVFPSGNPGLDFRFETFVDTAPVDEPGMLLPFLAAALGGVVLLRRPATA